MTFMEFIMAWFIVVIIGFLMFFGLFWSSIQEQILRHKKIQWIPWQELAKANNLSFTPGNFFAGAKVFGQYGRHFVTLVTFKGNSDNYKQTCTWLSFSVPYQASDNSSTTDGVHDIPLNINDVINLLSPKYLGHDVRWRVTADPMGRRISYTQQGIQTNRKFLQFLLDWLSDIADAYPAIVTLGGKAVPALQSVAGQNYSLEPLVIQLIYDIANETNTRLGYRAKDLICPRCFTYYSEHEVKLSWWQSITYYGCRTCHQSRKFFEGWVVARLDNAMTQEQLQENGVMRVNWLSRRALFDFDEIEIVQATDEDVERFAVQVGNDTDPLRKPRYQQMRCVVSAGCGLSENTHRILQRMFGSVEVRPDITNLDHIAAVNNLSNTEKHEECTEMREEIASFHTQ